jgi:phthalate 4,5-dioxygenase oxygenase subunit
MQAAQNELITRIGPGTACGDADAPLLAAGGAARRVRPALRPAHGRAPAQGRAPAGPGPGAVRDSAGRGACWTATARTAVPTWPLRGMKATACAARSTAGSSTPPAAAWTRRPNPMGRRCASACASAATRCSGGRRAVRLAGPGRQHAAGAARVGRFPRTGQPQLRLQGPVACNWLQAFEVGIDPAHASFLHRFLQDETLDGAYGRQFRGASAGEVQGERWPMTRVLREFCSPEIQHEELAARPDEASPRCAPSTTADPCARDQRGSSRTPS